MFARCRGLDLCKTPVSVKCERESYDNIPRTVQTLFSRLFKETQPACNSSLFLCGRLDRMWKQELSTKGEKASLASVFRRFCKRRLLLACLILILAMALLILSVVSTSWLLCITVASRSLENQKFLAVLSNFRFLKVTSETPSNQAWFNKGKIENFLHNFIQFQVGPGPG